MGSNVGDSMDLIEYGAGNDADVFPDGTTKVLKKGSLFRFEGHYHPYGEETFDRMRVGIKFYPKGVVPEHVVTSHRIRTGLGNDWVLNREKVEDLLLRAGYKLSIDEPSMPTGALIAENPLHAAELLSIPPNTVATHERFWPLPKPALIISFQPHMHFRGSKMVLEAIHPDGRREVLTSATAYEQNWQITYKYKVAASLPRWHDPSHHLDPRQHGEQQAQPRSHRVGRLGQPHDGRDGAWVDRHRVPDRRAVSGRARETQGAAQNDHDDRQQQRQEKPLRTRRVCS